ncbi:MAG: type II toxin-antitoxin system RelE/ParE family toxin [Gemmataceae bacterium]
MSLPVAFRPVAQAEYEAAAAWYEGQQAGLGTAFEAEVEAVLSVIAARPDRYPVAARDIREAPVARFPYCVYYRPRAGRVVVVAVFHQSRDPASWQSRA